MDAKLKEMTEYAEWCHKKRTEKIKSYRDKERREEEDSKKKFDEDFMHRQMKKTSNCSPSSHL